MAKLGPFRNLYLPGAGGGRIRIPDVHTHDTSCAVDGGPHGVWVWVCKTTHREQIQTSILDTRAAVPHVRQT